MILLLSPHCDDETLFACYTILKQKPLVLILNNEASIERKMESLEAMKILDAQILFINFEDLSFFDYTYVIEKVYAPALEGGHPLHDKLSRKAKEIFNHHVIYYSTYRNPRDLQPKGRIKVEATDKMVELKLAALSCYKSQIKVTPCHFRLKCKDEYYV